MGKCPHKIEKRICEEISRSITVLKSTGICKGIKGSFLQCFEAVFLSNMERDPLVDHILELHRQDSGTIIFLD